MYDFHKLRLGFQHKKCKDFFKVHYPGSATSARKVDSENRDEFEKHIFTEDIVIGDPLCRNCKVSFSDLLAIYSTNQHAQMTPNSKVRKACKMLNSATPPKIDKRDNYAVRHKKVDKINDSVDTGVRTQLFKLPQ